MEEKITTFIKLLEDEQLERLRQEQLDCEANIHNHKVSVKEGKKYIKIDVGPSGKYMIDQEGGIYGIKAYGVIHRGHYYGTLNTIHNYYWGDYKASKKVEVKR